MIDPLKDDTIINKLGGRFKLTTLMQKRWLELMQGGRPMVEPGNRSELDVIAQEILEEKITSVVPEAGADEEDDDES